MKVCLADHHTVCASTHIIRYQVLYRTFSSTIFVPYPCIYASLISTLETLNQFAGNIRGQYATENHPSAIPFNFLHSIATPGESTNLYCGSNTSTPTDIHFRILKWCTGKFCQGNIWVECEVPAWQPSGK